MVVAGLVQEWPSSEPDGNPCSLDDEEGDLADLPLPIQQSFNSDEAEDDDTWEIPF